MLAGVLWKKGSTFGGWTQRYYRFHPELSRLFYSKGEEGAIRGEIVLHRFAVVDLAASAASASAASAVAGQFRIECPNRAHVLRCDDPAALPSWVSALSVLSRSSDARETKTSGGGGGGGPVATHCAACKEPFGIMRAKHACAACALLFCGSPQCMEAKPAQPSSSSSSPSSSASTAASATSPPGGGGAGGGGRCCIPCAAARDASVALGSGGAPSRGGRKATPPKLNPKLKPSNANLLIRVMAGRHLMVCDASGSSDPYCCVFFDGQEYRTDTQFQTLNPTWNQQFAIPITGHSKDIQIGVYDSDKYSNDDFMVTIADHAHRGGAASRNKRRAKPRACAHCLRVVLFDCVLVQSQGMVRRCLLPDNSHSRMHLQRLARAHLFLCLCAAAAVLCLSPGADPNPAQPSRK